MKALFVNPRSAFEDLAREAYGAEIHKIRNRNTLNNGLDELVRIGIAEKRRAGKRMVYSLTAKGKREYRAMAHKNLNGAFLDIVEICRELQLRRSAKPGELSKAFLDAEMIENSKLDLETLSKAFNAVYGPLQEAYMSIQRIICEMLAPPELKDAPMFIGFTKRGTLHGIFNQDLEKKGFDLS